MKIWHYLILEMMELFLICMDYCNDFHVLDKKQVIQVSVKKDRDIVFSVPSTLF